eukprot:CAMPEP_0174850590 /NCGR_PEP_ID=MMETSP1114-20130205/20221_1 /TAXON_ID=312471 /ORGANISM="Neobodo designis, Strain CCAP 1951/1" /LENGTH=64 /DNA_ID=CAMNT_0016085059 /DNA_START=145 /DNA_END=336 /DNA_ORIENTATION=-
MAETVQTASPHHTTLCRGSEPIRRRALSDPFPAAAAVSAANDRSLAAALQTSRPTPSRDTIDGR